MKYFKLISKDQSICQFVSTESDIYPVPKDDTTTVEEISEEDYYQFEISGKRNRLDLFMPTL